MIGGVPYCLADYRLLIYLETTYCLTDYMPVIAWQTTGSLSPMITCPLLSNGLHASYCLTDYGIHISNDYIPHIV